MPRPNNPFKTGGLEVEAVIETWNCDCRDWPIVTQTLTWNPTNDMWRRDAWWVRSCGYCGSYPRKKG